MAGERTVKTRLGETTGRNPRTFVVAGTPNSGKHDLARTVWQMMPDRLTYVDVEQTDDYALGEMADYRAELYHALKRMFVYNTWLKNDQDTIIAGSLLDNMAWMYSNMERRMSNGTISLEEGNVQALAAALTASFVLDSFRATHVFLVYKPQDDLDEDIFYRQRIILRNSDVKYTILDEDTSDPVEACATIIQEYYE